MDNNPAASKISKKEDDDDRDKRSKNRAKRQEQDRDAKKKTRSGKSTEASVPGAHSSTGEHKSRTKKKSGGISSSHQRSSDDSSKMSRSNRSSGDSKDRSSRSRRSDEKSAYQSNHRTGDPPPVPGAVAESPSSHSRSRKRDEKGKERRVTRATQPGAQSSTSSKDRTKSKASGGSRTKKITSSDSSAAARRERRKNAEFDSSARSKQSQEPEVPIAATIVEDDDGEEEKVDEDTTKQQEVEARIQEARAAERRLMEAEQQRKRQEEEEQEERKEQERKKKQKRNKIICAVLVLLAIGGGVGAYFATQGGSSSGAVNKTTEQDKTLVPAADPSTSPSFNPTDDPSVAPTNLQLEHEQPSPEECERISSGLPIEGEDEMLDRSFAVPMEVDLLEGNDIDPLLPQLEIQIEKLFVPDLIGCSRDWFASRRRLGSKTASNANLSISTLHRRRKLQSVATIRYAIGKASVTVTVTDGGACEKSSSPNCSVVTAKMDLKVKGDYKLYLLITLIGSVFPNEKDLRPYLELDAPFNTIIIGTIESLDPTAAPSMSPTGLASETPSGSPSSSPSTSPTFAPVIGPTTGAPTKSPTTAPVVGPKAPAPTTAPSMVPSKTPSSTPSMAPSSTPPPTAAPLPGVTSSPTTLPSNSPSLSPSTSPSITLSRSPSTSPSTKPSLGPSAGPSIMASVAPSPVPTSVPSHSPTSSPTLTDLTNLYCGCTADRGLPSRDLEHRGPDYLGQRGCIVYCQTNGYDFAGLQFGQECWCGNNAGTYSFSAKCDYSCNYQGASSCYDGSSSCICGGDLTNSLFRTSTSVSCPQVTEESYTYLGCFLDNANRIMETMPMIYVTFEFCISLCRDIGFPFGGIGAGYQCNCSNQYDTIGELHHSRCRDYCHGGNFGDWGCGGDWAHSVYATGITSPVAALEDDLYCGCTADGEPRDLSHKAPYSPLTQKACIYYCKSKGYNFAGLQGGGNECYCGNNAGSYSSSQDCNLGCFLQEAPSICYGGASLCTCGGVLANSLFRTSTSVACPQISPSLFNPPRLGFIPLLRQDMVPEQSTTSESPANGMDGNYGTYSSTQLQHNAWWRIQLQPYYGQPVTVKQVTVWNRQDCCQDALGGAKVILWSDAPYPTNFIVSQTLTNAEVQTIDFGEVSGVHTVMIQQVDRTETTHFAEIEVWGSIPDDTGNHGYNGLTQQGMSVEVSSIWSNDPSFHAPVKALDGVFNNYFATESASGQWWRVNLQDYYDGQTVTVKKVTLWNAVHCCRDRLEGAIVRLYGAGNNNLLASSAPLTSALVQIANFGEVSGVARVQVDQASGKTDWFNFAEIEVWGSVP